MPAANIVDYRSNNYDTVCNAVFEPSYQDNTCQGATQFVPEHVDFYYHEINTTTIAQAISFAESKSFPITVYFYDCNNDNTPRCKL